MIVITDTKCPGGDVKITVTHQGEDSVVVWFRNPDTEAQRDAKADTIAGIVAAIIRNRIAT